MKSLTNAACVVVVATLVGAGCTPPVEKLFNGFGARGGLLGTVAESTTPYTNSFLLDVHYAGTLSGFAGLEVIPFEGGLSLATVESEDKSTGAALAQFRADFLFSKWESVAGKPVMYGLAGFRIVLVDVIAGIADSQTVSAIDLGVGLTSLEHSWDARFTFGIVLGGDNIRGLAMLTGGYRF